ncbi:MAG: hypothetical protein ACYC2H_08500 [Thermoplasmatota archaeon]
MKIIVICQAVTNAHGRQHMFMESPFGTFKFILGKSGKVEQVSLERSVAVEASQLPRFSMEGPKQHTLTIQEHPAIQEMRKWLQAVESFGSILMGIEKIDWERPEIRWEPETPEEKALTTIQGLKRESKYPKDAAELTGEAVNDIIHLAKKYPNLVVPLAFWREGSADFQSFKYIHAFYNWYFVIEDLFGGGNTKNPLVEKAMLASPTMTQAVEFTLNEFRSPGYERHRTKLEQELQARGFGYNVADCIAFLVGTRGRLHHYSQQNPQSKPIPFAHSEFQTIAYFLMTVTMNCLYAEMGYEMPIGRPTSEKPT